VWWYRTRLRRARDESFQQELHGNSPGKYYGTRPRESRDWGFRYTHDRQTRNTGTRHAGRERRSAGSYARTEIEMGSAGLISRDIRLFNPFATELNLLCITGFHRRGHGVLPPPELMFPVRLFNVMKRVGKKYVTIF